MWSSLVGFLLAVVLGGIWHAFLVRYDGQPAWARTVVRVLFAVTIVVQAVGYTIVQGMSGSVTADQVNERLNDIATTTALTDGTSAVLLGLAAALLGLFTVRRLLRGPMSPPPTD